MLGQVAVVAAVIGVEGVGDVEVGEVDVLFGEASGDVPEVAVATEASGSGWRVVGLVVCEEFGVVAEVSDELVALLGAPPVRPCGGEAVEPCAGGRAEGVGCLVGGCFGGEIVGDRVDDVVVAVNDLAAVTATAGVAFGGRLPGPGAW